MDASTGEIASDETKIFSQEVHDSRKQLQIAKKTEKKERGMAQDNIETIIAEDDGIWKEPQLSVAGSDASSTESKPKSQTIEPGTSEGLRAKAGPHTVPQSESATREHEATDSRCVQLHASTTSPEKPLFPDTGCDAPNSLAEDIDSSDTTERRYKKFWATTKNLAAVGKFTQGTILNAKKENPSSSLAPTLALHL